ncbi:MAG TPA: NAD(P)/FAD-dependent oxidoreductase [Sediminibacterium sp.]|jgi:predicted Rossmann fold flavoprotein|uniref:NAD(P)/FAD-dependent oxidoreductase n=1 Tax=Sediminibacterium sp. TaxID=1917865 RepID=UPI0008CA598C|nr:NAD(P)/FAD-dependent oxidoreductase [Sediminibacterium sp.]OHC84868.1 MAG: flavoprotein [Sphingobacteriia bacterium RIFOXYC2_FULL_35_18]OHC88942.1 MAG: flavoprotein [Sphingobacteriia bacterium RIFOXYD2_FULL_35_12]OYY11279.1 MAG: flavoprotein [Sphingobacteriia bacterium 35-36-14]OYZ53639.1 MAG: flavoprotein [Sphingobacteriia bacterium 24-36-13]OZA64131.1 MAG: flavoprotein [Sphingobacteriia bacterium 39-36-14]
MKKLIVIGGGAAGFFCAVNAARKNPLLSVTILEKSNKLLSKVKISGGGRCNTTHQLFEIPALIKKYPRGEQFLKKAFYQFNTLHTIEWFSERGVQLHAEADGRMFPVSNNSATIIECLLKEADQYHVKIEMQTEVRKITKQETQFQIETNKLGIIQADYICIACGGLPKMEMFNWISKLGHSIQSPVPSLFTFNMPKHPITALMGLSVNNAVIKISGTKLKEQGALLITHWGLSGPVVLKLSAWGARQLADMGYQFTIQVNWLGETTDALLRLDWPFYREQFSANKMGSKYPFTLPTRLWHFLLGEAGISTDTKWGELKAVNQNKLIQLLTGHVFDINGKTTFKEEFVTSGGVQLSTIHPQTMESKLVPGLYFAGEVMDIDGITGGFNFQHAWTSGYNAATAIAQSAL